MTLKSYWAKKVFSKPWKCDKCGVIQTPKIGEYGLEMNSCIIRAYCDTCMKERNNE